MKPPSRVKLRANRMNAVLSRGATTEEGKRRASQSNLTHGLYSAHVVLPGESQEKFDALVKDFVHTARPCTAGELALVRELAAIVWRSRRIRRLFRRKLCPGTPEFQILSDWQNSSAPLESLDARSAAIVIGMGFLEEHRSQLQRAFYRTLDKISPARRKK